MYAEHFHMALYHLRMCNTQHDLGLHHLNVYMYQAISCNLAVPFDVTLYNLTEYCGISSKADLFDLTLAFFARLCTISCEMLGNPILPCINCYYALPFHVQCIAIPFDITLARL